MLRFPSKNMVFLALLSSYCFLKINKFRNSVVHNHFLYNLSDVALSTNCAIELECPRFMNQPRRNCLGRKGMDVFGLVWNQQLWEVLPPTQSDTTMTDVMTWDCVQGDDETLLVNACCSRPCAGE